MRPGEKKEFDPTWFPTEWLVFIHHGPMSKAPNEHWMQYKAYSQGPNIGNVTSGEGASRGDVRKKRKIEKREDGMLFLSPSSNTSSSGSNISPLSHDFAPELQSLRENMQSVIEETREQTKAVKLQSKIMLLNHMTYLSEEEKQKRIEELYNQAF